VQAAKEYVISVRAGGGRVLPILRRVSGPGPMDPVWLRGFPRPGEFVNVMQALRSEHVFDMDLGYVSGLICFPSFHTILAMLSGLALRTVPYVRWVRFGLGGLIVFPPDTAGTTWWMCWRAWRSPLGVSLGREDFPGGGQGVHATGRGARSATFANTVPGGLTRQTVGHFLFQSGTIKRNPATRCPEYSDETPPRPSLQT